MGNIQQQVGNKLYEKCCGSQDNPSLRYQTNMERQQTNSLQLNPRPHQPSYTINNNYTAYTTISTHSPTTSKDRAALQTQYHQSRNQLKSTIILKQPSMIKSEYNKTSISLYEKPTIDKHDPNYQFMKSFKRMPTAPTSSSPHISPCTSPSLSATKPNVKLVKSLNIYRIAEDEEEVPYFDSGDELWRATSEHKLRFKSKMQEDFDWDSDEIMSVNFEMIEMKKPPLFNIYMNDIIYYKCKRSGEDFVIGCTAYMHIMKSEYDEGIYIYNLNTCEYRFLCDIPDELCDYQAHLAFDHENEVLHFLFGDGQVWGKYYLSKNVWEVLSAPNQLYSPMQNDYGIERLRNCKCLVVDEIPHVTGKGMHYIFDKTMEQFVDWPLTTQGQFEPKNLVHVPVLNRLYIFGGLGSTQRYSRLRYDE